jgi:hypothetical protein
MTAPVIGTKRSTLTIWLATANCWQATGRVTAMSRDIVHGGAQIIADVDHTLGRDWDSRRLAAWQHLV